MPTFTLADDSYDYVQAQPDVDAGEYQSWEYGQWPRVEADLPLGDGGTVPVHAEASRWTPHHIHVRWADDHGGFHGAWVPKGNVRLLAASEWDIIAYHQCPPELRSIQWGHRLPGFLPVWMVHIRPGLNLGELGGAHAPRISLLDQCLKRGS
jgi:hypothetical protein